MFSWNQFIVNSVNILKSSPTRQFLNYTHFYNYSEVNTYSSCLCKNSIKKQSKGWIHHHLLQQWSCRFSSSKKKIKVEFINPDGKSKIVEGEEGQHLLSLAHENDIDLEGACEGSLACSTCHVILDKKSYDLLDEPSDEENDMLDLAFGLTETSRLGCQVKLTPELEGLKAKLPSATRNMAVDGYKPKHH